VGPKTAARLNELGIVTIGDLAVQAERELVRIFGKNGYDMLRHARGIDESEVVTFHEPRSVSQETTFVRDVRDAAVLRKELTELALGTGIRLRRTGYLGGTVKLKLRWSDFTTVTRQTTLPAPTDRDEDILQAALALFEKHWPINRPVRLIGVGVSGLKPPARQLSLWDAPAQPEMEEKPRPLAPDEAARKRLDEALSELEQKFGQQVIRRGGRLY
jgi:DNA polymerase-4